MTAEAPDRNSNENSDKYRFGDTLQTLSFTVLSKGVDGDPLMVVDRLTQYHYRLGKGPDGSYTMQIQWQFDPEALLITIDVNPPGTHGYHVSTFADWMKEHVENSQKAAASRETTTQKASREKKEAVELADKFENFRAELEAIERRQVFVKRSEITGPIEVTYCKGTPLPNSFATTLENNTDSTL